MDVKRGNGKTTQEIAEILDTMAQDAYKFLEIVPGDSIFNQYGAEDLMEKWALYCQERNGKEGGA